MGNNKRDFGERGRVAGAEDYDVRYFAERHGLTMNQVRDLITMHERARLDVAADRLKKH